MTTGANENRGFEGAAVAGAATLGLLLGLGLPAAAQAEERVCRGTLGAVTVDNLRVPQGATCTLNGTRVQGTVKVERNATLTAERDPGDRQRAGRERRARSRSQLAGRWQHPGRPGPCGDRARAR